MEGLYFHLPWTVTSIPGQMALQSQLHSGVTQASRFKASSFSVLTREDSANSKCLGCLHWSELGGHSVQSLIVQRPNLKPRDGKGHTQGHIEKKRAHSELVCSPQPPLGPALSTNPHYPPWRSADPDPSPPSTSDSCVTWLLK